MTQDLDQSLELIGGIIALIFCLPFFMAWLEDTLHGRPGLSDQPRRPNLKPYLPTRWSSRGRR